MEKIKYAFFFIFIGKAALISAMMFAPATSAQTSATEQDTFVHSPKTEYVTEQNDRLSDDVFVWNADETPVGNKERGEFINRWFWAMFSCADEDGKFQDDRLGNAPKFIKVPNKDYKQLAADIICTFDKNGDNKVDFGEYLEKSNELIEQNAGRRFNLDEKREYATNYFIPWFNGFNYDFNSKEYTVDEVAATIYALDKYSSLGKGILNGEKLVKELNYVKENGSPDDCFQRNMTEYYDNNNLLR